MPKITSPRQFRAMQAAVHGKGQLGIPPKVAQAGLAELGHEKRSKFAHVIRLKRTRKQGRK